MKIGVSPHTLFQNGWLNSVLFLSPCSPALPSDWSFPGAFTIRPMCPPGSESVEFLYGKQAKGHSPPENGIIGVQKGPISHIYAVADFSFS